MLTGSLCVPVRVKIEPSCGPCFFCFSRPSANSWFEFFWSVSVALFFLLLHLNLCGRLWCPLLCETLCEQENIIYPNGRMEKLENGQRRMNLWWKKKQSSAASSHLDALQIHRMASSLSIYQKCIRNLLIHDMFHSFLSQNTKKCTKSDILNVKT